LPLQEPCDVAWPKAHSAARYRRVKAFFFTEGRPEIEETWHFPYLLYLCRLPECLQSKDLYDIIYYLLFIVYI